MPIDLQKIFLFSFYYSKWDCSKFLSVNILSINIHSLLNLALRICDKAATLIWFFCRYPLYRNPFILWSQLFVQQKATLLWKSMLAFWSFLARILFHKIKLINSHTNQINPFNHGKSRVRAMEVVMWHIGKGKNTLGHIW